MSDAYCFMCGEVSRTKEPTYYTKITMMNTGCAHGVGEWETVETVTGGRANSARLGDCLLQLMGQIDLFVQDHDRFPHCDWYLYGLDNPMLSAMYCGLKIGPERLSLYWDPCPRQEIGFHSVVDLNVWSLSQIRTSAIGSDDSTVIQST